MKLFNYSQSIWEKFRGLSSPSDILSRIKRRWPWKFALAQFPRTVAIEVTNRCNLRCVMCHRERMTRAQGSMAFEDFTSIAGQAIDGGARLIIPFNYGEPLLHPRLADMVAFVKNRDPGVQIKFNTNGMLLTKDRISALLSAGLDELTISLEGADAKTHEALATGSNYETIMKNIESFLRLRAGGAFNTRLRICMVRMEDNVAEIDDFIRKWRPRVDSLAIHDVNTGAGALEDRRVEKSPIRRRYPCRELWGKLVVLWNGDVTVCCIDFDGRLTIGNVLRGDRLDKLWHGEKLSNLRSAHTAGAFSKFPMCAHCDSDDTL